jgi:hypothetical protein
MWQCPHCGTPQAETAHCWVCRRSSTTCSTCRNFRASLAAEVGYCGLDRHRRPLSGLELRACWEEGPAAAAESSVRSGSGNGLDADRRSARRRPGVGSSAYEADRAPARTFIPIEDVERAASAAAPVAPGARAGLAPELPVAPALLPREAIVTWEGRTSLFGDLDR